MSGQLPLMAAIKKLMDEVLSGTSDDVAEGPLAEERKLIATAKKITLFAAGFATPEVHAGDPGPAGDPGSDRQHDH